MHEAEHKEWLMQNSIIYRIYTKEDFDGMREGLLEDLKAILRFDSADFYLADPEKKGFICRPVGFNSEVSAETAAWSAGAGEKGGSGCKTMVCRSTDIAEGPRRKKPDYFAAQCRRNNWHYYLQMVLARENAFLGVVTFYRLNGRENFTLEDIFLLDMLKEHLSWRLSTERKKTETGFKRITVVEAIGRYGLTHQEGVILSLLMEGKEHPDICETLHISENTLKKHIVNIHRKTGVRNRVQQFRSFCGSGV